MYKILYVGKFIPNEGAAGIHVYNIAKCLEEQGVEIVYVAYSKKSFKENRIYTRVRDKDCIKNRVKRANIVRSTLC